MLPILSIKDACVGLLSLNLASKMWMTIKWRVLHTNKKLGKPVSAVADWKLVPELVNNTNEAYAREHGTQLNESEYTPVFVAMLGLMHAVNADPGQAPGMMLYSSLAYTAASAFAGFPFYVPAAIWRYGAFALGLKKIFEAKNF
ncbi:unnamed protein product [Bathycoccus prasinos]